MCRGEWLKMSDAVIIIAVTIENESAIATRHVPFMQLPVDVLHSARNQLAELVREIDDYLGGHTEDIADALARDS